MSAQLITAQGRQLLIGGSWRIAETPLDLKSLRGRDRSGQVIVEVLHGSDRCIATYKDLKVGGVCYAGGAVVAKLAPTVLVTHNLSDDRCWVFAAIDGIPVPGFDQVVRTQEVRAIRNELSISEASFELIGDAPDSTRTLEELLGEAEDAVWRLAAFTPTGTRLRPLILGGAAVAAFGAAAAAYFVLFAGRADHAPQQAAAAASATASAPIQSVATAALPASAASAPPVMAYMAQPVLGEMIRGLRQLPLSRNGWTPHSVSCKPADLLCTVSWKATEGARLEDAKEIPGADVGLHSALSKRVESQFPLSPSERQLDVLTHDEGLALYSLGSDDTLPEGVTIQVQGIGQTDKGATIPVTASGPLWAWQVLAARLTLRGLTITEVQVQQLDTTSPTLRVSGKAQVASAAN